MQKEFLDALASLQDSITAIVKQEDNPYFKSKYADLNAIFDEVKQKIRNGGFILVQTVQHNYLHTELIHIATGEKLESDMDLLTVEPNMQQLGSAVTYARRYSLLPMLNIETKDDDGNNASGKEVPEPKTFGDFCQAINSAKTSKEVGALYYKFKAVFPDTSAQFKELNAFSGNMRMKLENPQSTVDVFFHAPHVKEALGVK